MALSKHLTKLLRHRALEDGVHIDVDGWAKLSEAVEYVNSQGNVLTYTEADVADMVSLNDKQRFEVRARPGLHDSESCVMIRATQGHTMRIGRSRPIGTALGATLSSQGPSSSSLLRSRNARASKSEQDMQALEQSWQLGSSAQGLPAATSQALSEARARDGAAAATKRDAAFSSPATAPLRDKRTQHIAKEPFYGSGNSSSEAAEAAHAVLGAEAAGLSHGDGCCSGDDATPDSLRRSAGSMPNLEGFFREADSD